MIPSPTTDATATPGHSHASLLDLILRGTTSSADLSAIDASSEDIAGLTDEAILDLLRSRLRDVDGQVNDITRTLQSRTQEAQRLGQEAQRLNVIREYIARDPFMEANGNLKLNENLSPIQLRELESRLGLPEGHYGDGPANVRSVLAATEINGVSLSSITTRDTFATRAENVSEAIRQANSGNEQLMVKLQSSMQQRTQTVQMCTNMLKSLNDAQSSIVGNLR